ncbi:MAG: cellulase family glycosylhydrolase [Lachnospiraceae bacterium]|nr:cellulase family glycosylhydrolase [Lachnospiraceae bacterium]
MSHTISSLPLLVMLTLGLVLSAGLWTSIFAKASETEASSEIPASAEASSEASDSAETPDTENVGTADVSATAGEVSTIPAPSACGALQVIGTQLSDENGNAVQLKGVSTLGLAWYPEYINYDCFAQLKNEWNVSLIRLAMYTAESGGYCTDGDQENLKTLIRNGVEYATELDMYVIIDWHILSDGNPNTYLEEAKAFFEEMSAEFADHNNILYEICNEPNGNVTWADIKAYAAEILPIIRANDSDAVILVGTPNWSQYVDQAAADPITGYDNLMYTLHYYAATHTDYLRSTLVAAMDARLPIFVSEYGISDASGNGTLDIGQANTWMELLDDRQISCAMWSFSNRDESSAIIKSTCTKTSGFTTDDLTDSGKWLYEMLTGGADSGSVSADGSDNTAEGSIDSDSASTDGTGTTAEDTATDSSDSADAADNVAANAAAGNGTSADTTGSAAADAADGSNTTAATSDNAAMDSSGNGGSSDGSSAESVVSSPDSLSCTAAIVNQWESDGVSFYQYSVTLENTSDAELIGWVVDLTFAGSITLSDSWNGEYALDGTTLTITPKDYNETIAAGGTLSDIGFIVSGTGTLE